ncbi:family 1 glycosylhydrolase [Luteimonas huabeiensis]|uniref:family 1 glycosylhydrolase n=1 Tax=Luteimonas huabeiensis TaxID=1244513 RepID=UPI00046740EA|nr:family 1 glycosylhydrolase [Luteimonas huabeiensis]
MARDGARGCAPGPIELWGGVECSVVRIGDGYSSQFDYGGCPRPGDIDAFAALGVRALRQPVLWERVAPRGLRDADWRWPDACLQRIRALGIRPIVGLLHHGSGPRHTSLLDPAFPDELAAYAGAVAARYPWVLDYTPVNEPLTTARFSGLYGHWYPHRRDPPSFWRALHAQCRGIAQAMRAIRRVQPRARLVQTDDLGRTYATPPLQYQADFNNHLRWLGWDLLYGRVGSDHPLWSWLVECCRAQPEDLLWFAAHRCRPDVVGVNHYVTSERYLDEDPERYPPECRGGNGRHRYADVEAARVLSPPSAGLSALLREAWSRYRLPLAVTESHLHAPREDQLRWLAETWRAVERAREAGADVRAVTLWALLGSYDWDRLLTQRRGHYEPGAFEVRRGRARTTAIARMAAALARGDPPAHPVLAQPGWWRRPSRLLYARAAPVPGPPEPGPQPGARSAPILIAGAGTLGRAFSLICGQRALDHRLLARAELDIADPAAVERSLDACAPWAVINAAGYVRVDDAETDPERCFRENVLGAQNLAAACARAGIPLVTFSTDLVFDGARSAPYPEDAAVAPLNVYGRCKARAEACTLDRHPGALVVRTSAFFGPWDEANFLAHALRALRAGGRFDAADDLTVSPTYVPDLVHACLDLLIDAESGIWHLASGTALTWAEFARRAARMAGADVAGLRARPHAELGLAARRPRYSALGSSRAFAMPALDDALARYLREGPPAPRIAQAGPACAPAR